MIDLVRQEVINAARTVVIKIGTNVLTGADGLLDRVHLAHLTEQVAEIVESGRQVAIVSSGAIGAGLGRLGIGKRPTALPELQAAAAIGQTDLIRAYEACLANHGFHAGQILLTSEDFDDRQRYLNVRNTILQLFAWKSVPIINENDTVSVKEIKFGDNDRLAAMVTNLLRAQLLVILSIVDGLYPGDIKANPDLQPIDKVIELDDDTLAMAGTSTSGLGTGGMRSKLESVRIATRAGETVWIANGKRPDILRQLFRGEKTGTLFMPKGGSMKSRKRWVGFTARPRGSYIVDDGAAKAVRENGRSLLPIGVVEIKGEFEPGDVVAVETSGGVPIARGLTNYSASEAKLVMGQPTAKIAKIIPNGRYNEMIHRDNLVIL